MTTERTNRYSFTFADYGQLTLKNFFLGFCLIILAGCQSVHPRYDGKHSTGHVIQDGAPLGLVPKIFKAVIPMSEPLSRYGNPATYRVLGHRYAVMNSAKGYKERGLASWYGTKFHSRRTSSGEHYDMYALTAAHKTLPLPTYVRVKNLDNGRVAIVKVNDRGPFHPGRIIDLSYGAAAKLGVYPKGTAHVEIEAITVNAKQRAVVESHHQYYVQVGAFSTKNAAEQLKHKITRFFSAAVFIKHERRQYMVRLGPFTDRGSMQRAQATLAKKGIRGSFSLMS